MLLIARLTISPALEIGLADVEGFDPAGKLARHYSGKVTVRDGRAAFHIPFALNDAPCARLRQRPYGRAGAGCAACFWKERGQFEVCRFAPPWGLKLASLDFLIRAGAVGMAQSRASGRGALSTSRA